MPNVPVPTRTPIQWAALVATAALLWGVVWSIGSQFRDYMRVDVRQLVTELVAEHSKDANASRTQFFKDIESDAHAAIGRISDMERNCAVVQKQLTSIEGRLDGLDHWRTECGKKMAGVEQYMARDAADIRDLEQDVNVLQDLVRAGKRQ